MCPDAQEIEPYERQRKKNGPVVIGGVGGSGTRVIAEILSKFGFYIGSDLNSANDNLLYSLLFKRPKWFYRNCHNRNEINMGIRLFHKLMLREGVPSLPEVFFLLRAVGSTAFFGRNIEGSAKRLWPLMRVQRLLFSSQYVSTQYVGWGWKEPNSHLLIENVAEHFPDFKYIHTIRHGLDMAFSRNQRQLYNWGPLYGVQRPVSRSEEPRASLKYWIKVNEKVLNVGKQIGDNRFLLMNFDQLCLSPESGIRNLLGFLGIEVDKEVYQEAILLPKTPSSTGRYRSQDIRQLDEEDLRLLPKFGFSVE